jgi:hypothetical protein
MADRLDVALLERHCSSAQRVGEFSRRPGGGDLVGKAHNDVPVGSRIVSTGADNVIQFELESMRGYP